MLATLQMAVLLLAAVPMALSLAHALELPGKMRLAHDDYLKVQTIYYPGFTIGGIVEFAAMIAVAALLAVTPAATFDFWLTLLALIALIAMHAVFWTVTQPANRFWLAEQDLNRAAATFFGTGSGRRQPGDWIAVRDRWEYSHVMRAVLSFMAFGVLAGALAFD